MKCLGTNVHIEHTCLTDFYVSNYAIISGNKKYLSHKSSFLNLNTKNRKMDFAVSYNNAVSNNDDLAHLKQTHIILI